MRLIDADKLPEVNTIERIDGDREVFVSSWIPATAIWKAPTVEAIPIEWVKKYLAKLIVVQDDLDYPNQLLIGRVIGIEIMLEEWEKENEDQNL